MSKACWLGIAVLSAAAMLSTANSQIALGQGVRVSGAVGQGDKDKKDKDKDRDEGDRKDRKRDKDKDNDDKNQSGQNNQGRQGNQNPQSNQGNQANQSNQGGQNNQNNNSSDTDKSDKSNKQQAIQQFLKRQQDARNQKVENFNKNRDNNSGSNLQDQGNSNNPNQQGFPGQQPGQQGNRQRFRDNDDRGRDRDHDNDRDQKNSFKIGVWQGDRWNGPRKLDNWAKAYGGTSGKPFSSQWYQQHPKAWKFDKGETNFFITTSVPSVYRWLGWGSVPPQYNVGYGNAQVDFSRFGQWYPLGVYSLMSGPDDQGTRVVQLAVDRRGNVTGNYYDMIVDSSYDISGEVRQANQRVYFSLERNPSVTFRASLYSLFQPYGNITVQMPGGDQRWQFVRLEE